MDESHFPCNKLKTCCKRQGALEIRRQKLGDTERAAKEMLDLETRMTSPDEKHTCFHMHSSNCLNIQTLSTHPLRA